MWKQPTKVRYFSLSPDVVFATLRGKNYGLVGAQKFLPLVTIVTIRTVFFCTHEGGEGKS